MNTSNNIAVAPDTRQLKRTISNGVRDVNKSEHFPALPAANMHSTSGPRLRRMSTSFKDVVKTEPESQELPVIFESSDASPSASPRVGARHQPVESKPAQVVRKVDASQPLRLQQASDVDVHGFRQPKGRQSGSPRSPKDFSAAQAALSAALNGTPTASQDRLFGFPAHSNRFSLLAESGSSRTRSASASEETTSGDHSTAANSIHTLSGAAPKAESTGPLKESDYQLYDTSLLWRESRGPSQERAWRLYNTSLLWKSSDIQAAEEEDLYDASRLWAESSQAQAAQEEDVNSSTEHPQLREGGSFSMVGGAAQGIGQYAREHPKSSAVMTVVALTAVKFLLSRRRR